MCDKIFYANKKIKKIKYKCKQCNNRLDYCTEDENILFCDECNIEYCSNCYTSSSSGDLMYSGEDGYTCLGCELYHYDRYNSE